MKPKIIALYLPQFHTIPENDEWWGEGFTEWVNVRNSKPLFSGHNQPRVPLNGNYYDLSQVDTLRWQASLANEYGVYGFCFYHYWFANGKRLLEKPAEMLLANGDIPLRFCFSWANEPWARTWDGKAHQVLMPQEYGEEKDWREHFDYLLPFFKDERYIKEDGKPMFVIYKMQSIPNLKEMMDCWIAWAQEAGLPGIHFVETLRDRTTDKRDLPISARMEFEPVMAEYHDSNLTLNYNRIRRRILNVTNHLFGKRALLNRPLSFTRISALAKKLNSPVGTYGGAFVGWDNSPRRGLAATIIKPATKEEFKDFLASIMHKTINTYHTQYVFINAWNEWAEGTYLEPDELNKYAYLEAIKELLADEK